MFKRNTFATFSFFLWKKETEDYNILKWSENVDKLGKKCIKFANFFNKYWSLSPIDHSVFELFLTLVCYNKE